MADSTTKLDKTKAAPDRGGGAGIGVCGYCGGCDGRTEHDGDTAEKSISGQQVVRPSVVGEACRSTRSGLLRTFDPVMRRDPSNSTGTIPVRLC